MRKRPPTKGEHSKEKNKEQPLICQECKKSGHFRSKCPQLKKGPKKYKKKTIMATWSDSDESSSEEEDSHEQANLCLMAHENEVNTKTSDDFTFEELQKVFYDLVDDLKKLRIKNKELKSKNQFLLKKMRLFQIKNWS